MTTNKQIDKLIASGAVVDLANDHGVGVAVRFTKRDRAYGECVVISTGDCMKLHRDDIIIMSSHRNRCRVAAAPSTQEQS